MNFHVGTTRYLSDALSLVKNRKLEHKIIFCRSSVFEGGGVSGAQLGRKWSCRYGNVAGELGKDWALPLQKVPVGPQKLQAE